MRALGRGSVSSFLKVILDVFHVVLWVGVGLATAGAVAALLIFLIIRLPFQKIASILKWLCVVLFLYLISYVLTAQ